MKTMTFLLVIAVAAVVPADVALALDGSESPQSNGKTPHRIPRVACDIRVDGVLDESIWKDALVMGVNNEVRPGDNVPAPVETDMLLAYDDECFYIAFRAYDPDPSQIRARLCDRDRMWDDEWVVIGIDTYNDQRGGFEFACNPFGIQGDTASGVHGNGNSWDAIWDSAGRITGWGYVVEMAIPFSSLRFQRTEGDQVWGVDAVRSYPRDVRHHISLYERDRDNNCYYCQMEKLVGFAGVSPGNSIEIDPTISAIASQERDPFPAGDFAGADDEYDVGATARWGVTPNVTVSGALNPDFSQVEADAFQLDVNRRYAISYEEKRPFFLEGGGIFGSYFYSRSIADPAWGVKLNGKEGPSAFGFLVARDELTNVIVPGTQQAWLASLDMESTASVARYRHDVGDNSVVELAYNGREGDGFHNRFGALRGDFWLTDSMNFDAAIITSRTKYHRDIVEAFGQPADEIEGEYYHASLGRYTSGLDVYANYTDCSDGFRDELGFFQQKDFRHTEVGAGHTWQTDASSWWTMLNFGGCYTVEETRDGEPLTKGANFWANYAGPKELEVDLTGWTGTTNWAGEEFRTWEVGYGAAMWPTGDLFTRLNGEFAESVDYGNVRLGTKLRVSPYFMWKIGRHISTAFDHNYERFDVDGKRLYTAHISYLRAIYQFSPRAFVRAIVQYRNDNLNPALYPDGFPSEAERFASQLLFSYKINPQTVFFLGYSDLHEGVDEIALTQSERTFFAKLGYALTL